MSLFGASPDALLVTQSGGVHAVLEAKARTVFLRGRDSRGGAQPLHYLRAGSRDERVGCQDEVTFHMPTDAIALMHVLGKAGS